MLNCKSLIMDVDGVIFDSNQIKENNIREAASPYLGNDELEDFIRFFIAGNGIPREIKIAQFFGEQTIAYHEVLDAYNSLNQRTLNNAPLTKGSKEFIRKQSEWCEIWAVSGGAEQEVKELLCRYGLLEYFKGVHGGPISKKEHLIKIKPPTPVSYIGDSKIDHESAMYIGASFIFMYAYTQVKDWLPYFQNFPEVTIIKDLTELYNLSIQ
jgi:beta-phosphoglucomutase-like phosphatase (HAD superfamily)